MIAAVFPGQGSQKPGMGQELHDCYAEAKDVFERVSDALGFDVARLCFESDEETLRRTENTQVALFTCSVAAFRVLPEALGRSVAAAAGHSVGEFAALCCAGILDLPSGARLVRRRGELMAQSKGGAMTAVLGMERGDLEHVCRSIDGVVVVANDNCPGQLVISGESDAVKAAGEQAIARGAKRALPLNVSGAFHSPLMESAAQELAVELASVQFQTGLGLAVYSNVTAEPVCDPEMWPKLLEAQLRSPVRWTETVQNMIRDGSHAFIECGVGEVISGLIRRVDKSVSTNRVNDRDSLANTLHDLAV